MQLIGKILFIIALVAAAIDYLIAKKYCTPGFLGYPDKWHNKNAAKVHIIIAPISIITIIASVVFLAISHYF